MKEATILEQIILTTIWKLRGDAYGVKIRKKVVETLNKEIFYGTLYNNLDQLVKKGYVTKSESEPLGVVGGRRKMLYLLTAEGMEVLKRAKELQKLIWEGVPENFVDGGENA